MGLDMFLNEVPAGLKSAMEQNMDDAGMVDRDWYEDNWESLTAAGYWRKANAVHRWFVENVQGGLDEQDTYAVTWGDLESLKEACMRVLADHSLADEVLPAQQGIFFGGTDYDEWYFHNLEDTVEIIDRLDKKGAYMYTASW